MKKNDYMADLDAMQARINRLRNILSDELTCYNEYANRDFIYFFKCSNCGSEIYTEYYDNDEDEYVSTITNEDDEPITMKYCPVCGCKIIQ